jgi:hypothetical protein
MAVALASFFPVISRARFLTLSPCEKEHQASEKKHHQSPPEIHINKEGSLVGGSISEESKNRQQNAEDDEQQAQRKTKVNVHNRRCKMSTKDEVKNEGQY